MAEWDLFISHASEDKDAFVRPLAQELHRQGIKVWYDEWTLHIGDSIRRSIDRGLSDSRYGLVILSKAFFRKEWPQRELDGLAALEQDPGSRILPVWYDIDHSYVLSVAPMLADRVAAKSTQGMPFIVDAIIDKINNATIYVSEDKRYPSMEGDTMKKQSTHLVNCDKCGMVVEVINPFPNKTPTKIWPTDLGFTMSDSIHIVRIACPHCRSQLWIKFQYGRE